MASKVTQKKHRQNDSYTKTNTHTQIYVEENFIAFIQNKDEEKN